MATIRVFPSTTWLLYALVSATIAGNQAAEVHVDKLFTPPSCLLTSQLNDRLAL